MFSWETEDNFGIMNWCICSKQPHQYLSKYSFYYWQKVWENENKIKEESETVDRKCTSAAYAVFLFNVFSLLNMLFFSILSGYSEFIKIRQQGVYELAYDPFVSTSHLVFFLFCSILWLLPLRMKHKSIMCKNQKYWCIDSVYTSRNNLSFSFEFARVKISILRKGY